MKTSDLCDATDDAMACVLPLQRFGQHTSFCGTVRTVRCLNDVGLVRQMVRQVGTDQVLVIDGGGSLDRALFGDVMAGIAIQNGWQGLVVFGAIRDVAEINEMPIGVHAFGTAPRRGGRTGQGELDVPVQFGGVTFTPGCRLVADADGVVVLPMGSHENQFANVDSVAQTLAYLQG